MLPSECDVLTILPRTYTLVITATDHGDSPRSADAVLIVNVGTAGLVDCNDLANGNPYAF